MLVLFILSFFGVFFGYLGIQVVQKRYDFKGSLYVGEDREEKKDRGKEK